MKGNPIDLYQILENSDGNIPVYMTCGDKDFIYESDVKFVEAMKEKGMNVDWISVKGYEHEWRFWNLAIERFLDWIPRTDEYSNARRKV